MYESRSSATPLSSPALPARMRRVSSTASDGLIGDEPSSAERFVYRSTPSKPRRSVASPST